jgi:hypothetical protein
VTKSIEDVAQESRQVGDAWAVQQAKEAVFPVSVLTSEQSVARMRELPVTNDLEEAFAAQLLREVKDHWAEVEAKRKKITVPMNEALRETNKTFRPALDALKEEEDILKGKIAGYVQVKEQANTAALQAASVASTPAAAQQALSLVAPVAPPAGVSVRYVWKFAVEDESLVPREFCSPDAKKIGAVDPTQTSIPGVRFFQESVVSSRRNS